MSNATKIMLALALKDLMRSKPLNKITINDIAQKCGINRMTFYYHFSDIYELIEWMCKEYIIIGLEKKVTYSTWQEGMLELMQSILKNKTEILNLYNSVGSRQMRLSLQRLLKQTCENVINEISDGMDISDEDKELAVYYYNTSLIALILNWIENGMKEPPERIVSSLNRMLHGSLTLCLENMRKDKN